MARSSSDRREPMWLFTPTTPGTGTTPLPGQTSKASATLKGKAVTKRDYGPCAVYEGDPAPKYTKPVYTRCQPVKRPDGVP